MAGSKLYKKAQRANRLVRRVLYLSLALKSFIRSESIELIPGVCWNLLEVGILSKKEFDLCHRESDEHTALDLPPDGGLTLTISQSLPSHCCPTKLSLQGVQG